MTIARNPRGMTRRELLASGTALGAAFVIGAGFVAHSTDAWAVEVKALKPETMATMILLARDIYPHDRLADKYYAAAVKSHDDKAAEDAASAIPFDRRRVIGLHHLALGVADPQALEVLHGELATRDDVEIEFAPESLGSGPAEHMMCRIPGDIRLELIALPAA